MFCTVRFSNTWGVLNKGSVVAGAAKEDKQAHARSSRK